MIAVRDLTVAFGGVRPLDGVTAEFSSSICGLIGPNGAGKTTLLNVLSGFVAPRSGSVSCEGVDLLAMKPQRRARWGVRRTFQQEQIVDALTVEGNLTVALENCGRGSDGASVADVFAYLGVDADLSTPSTLLSARDRRLVEIGRTLVGSPRIILLDEPGAGLAEDETAHLSELIGGLPDRFDVKVLLIDHDMELVRGTCEHLVVLDFGRLIADGDCSEVLERDSVRRAYLGVAEEES